MPDGTDIGTYDIFLEFSSNKVGFILGKDEQGNKRYWPGLAPVLAQQINTGGFSYEQLPSEIDIPVPMEHWSMTGVIDEGLSPLPSYHYSQGIDASHGTRLYLSPARQAVIEDDDTAIAAAPVKFVDTSLGFFFIAGTYIYELEQTNQEWVERDDASGDAVNYTDIVEMDAVLYACRGDSTAYKYSTDGVTWTAYSDAALYFNRFAVRGISTSQWGESILWGIKDDGTVRNTTDGKNGGITWSAADAVGHTSETVNGFIEANDDLYAYKKEGIYRYTGTLAEDVWTGGKQMQRDTNGDYPYLWYDGKMYAPYGDRLLQFDPTQTDGISLAFVFPTDAGEASDELNGTITGIAGDSQWLYVALKNVGGNSYVLKGNPYKNNGLGEWHTFIYLGANDCNALFVAGPGTVHSQNPALVVGYGTAASYYILSRAGLRPEDDTNYQFDTGSSHRLVGSWKSVGAQAFPKFLNAGRVVTENTTSGRSFRLLYEVDTNLGVETALVTASSPGSTTASVSTDVSFNRVREIVTASTSDTGSTPVMIGAIFNATPNPPRKRVWSFEVVVGDELEANGGVSSRYSGKELEAFLFNSLNQRVTLYDRRNRSFTVKVLDIRSVRAAPTSQGGDTESVSVNAAQVG